MNYGNENYATRKFPLRIEAMCVRILYRILRQYSYNRNMEAMNILYKELVLEGVIPEFKFNMEVWKMINRVKMYGNGIKKEF